MYILYFNMEHIGTNKVKKKRYSIVLNFQYACPGGVVVSIYYYWKGFRFNPVFTTIVKNTFH